MTNRKTYKSQFAGQDIAYYYYLPDKLTDKTPLLVHLHGMGARGSGTSIDWAKLIAESWVVDYAEKEKLPFAVVAPQQPSRIPKLDAAVIKANTTATKKGNTQIQQWTVDLVPEVVDLMRQEIKVKGSEVDESRKYVEGYSMGGGGVWGCLDKFPDMFAAAIPICGIHRSLFSEENWNHVQKIADSGVALWLFHNDKDPTVKNAVQTRMYYNQLKAAGAKDIKKTIFRSNSHNAWDTVYKFNPKKNIIAEGDNYDGKIWDWMLSKSKAVEEAKPEPVPTPSEGKTDTPSLETYSTTVMLSGKKWKVTYEQVES